MFSTNMEGEKFCLRWNELDSNLSSAVRDLRDSRELLDLTLACGDSDEDQVQVHRVVLSAASSFFRNLLRRLPHQHPVVYLKGIKLTDLQAVLSFVYNGEVNIAQQDLSSFLVAAEDLKIKGLTQGGEKQRSLLTSCPPLKPAPPTARPVTSRPLSSVTIPPTSSSSSSSPSFSSTCNNVETNAQLSVKIEPPALDESPNGGDVLRPDSADQLMEENDLFISDENKDFSIGLPLTVGVAGEGNKGNDLGHGLENCQLKIFAVEVLIKEESIESLNPDDELEMLGELYKCRLCYKSLDCLDTAKNHILAHFALPGGLTCLQCGLSFNSKVLFGVHMSSEHRNIKKW